MIPLLSNVLSLPGLWPASRKHSTEAHMPPATLNQRASRLNRLKIQTRDRIGQPLFATQYGTGIRPTVEGGILNRSSRSSLVFPSGMVCVYAALDRGKQSQFRISKLDKQDPVWSLWRLAKGGIYQEGAGSYQEAVNIMRKHPQSFILTHRTEQRVWIWFSEPSSKIKITVASLESRNIKQEITTPQRPESSHLIAKNSSIPNCIAQPTTLIS